MTEKHALNITLLSLSVSGVVFSLLFMLPQLLCEELIFLISKGYSGKIVTSPFFIILTGIILLLLIIFLVFQGIFLSKCYQRSFPALKNWKAYLIVFGSMLIPFPLLYWLMLFIVSSRNLKRQSMLFLLLIFAVLLLPFFIVGSNALLLTHVIFYESAAIYILYFFFFNSLAEENISRETFRKIIIYNVLTLLVFGIIIGYNAVGHFKVKQMEFDLRTCKIPVTRTDLDKYITQNKIYNADTEIFKQILKKIEEKVKAQKDFSEYMPEFEKYSGVNHLLGKESIGQPILARRPVFLNALQAISGVYIQRMNNAQTADELIKNLQLGNRLNKFYADSDTAVFICGDSLQAIVNAFAYNMKRFKFTAGQKDIIATELQKFENEIHHLYLQSSLFFPVRILDSIDVFVVEKIITKKNSSVKMHPLTGAFIYSFIYKSKYYARCYVDLISRKYNVFKDYYQLPAEKIMPDAQTYRKNIFITMIISDRHEIFHLRKKNEIIYRARQVRQYITNKTQTDPFTGRGIVTDKRQQKLESR